MASVNEAMLLDEVSWAGSSRSAEGDRDPRLIEQPHSAIAANAIGTEARGPSRKAPKKALETGIAIDAGYSRVYAVLVARGAAKRISAELFGRTPLAGKHS